VAARTDNIPNNFRELRSDYTAANESRFRRRRTGVDAAGTGADYHYRDESKYFKMMEYARDMDRNDAVVGQLIDRAVTNMVQGGFKLDTNTGDKKLDEELWARWQEWATDADQCDLSGELNFYEMEQLVPRQQLVDGDIVVLPVRDGPLQLVEAHRIRTPRSTKQNVVHGVLMDDSARRLEYWLTKEDLNPNQPLIKVSDILPYKARDPKTGERQVLHLYQPYRFSQRRGVTALAPVSDTVGMHDDIQFATLVKAQMAALIAILHERGPDWRPTGDQQKGDREQDTVGGYTKTIEGVSAGLEIFGDPDEKLSAFSANIPSPEFFPHAMMVLTFIAINLDLPVHVLLLDPSNTNFSGWRGAIDQARLRFKQIQKWFAECFHTPIYRWKVRQWAARDPSLSSRLEAENVRLFGHRWNPPAFAYLEPLTDASADLLQQRNALNSARRIHAARGREWKVVAEEIVADNGMAILLALAKAETINKLYPEAAVHWRELISLPTPDGVQIALQQPGQPEQNGGGAARGRTGTETGK